MHCFNHPDADAIGICKVCGKGLCPACAADLGHSLTCKGAHEGEAQATRRFVQQSMNFQGIASQAKYVAPVFFIFMGGLFASIGWGEPSRLGGTFTAMGLAFIVFGLVLLITNRRAYGKRRPKD